MTPPLPPEPRVLSNPTRFILDVGVDGFNAYRVGTEGLELFAASSSATTFCRVMSDILEMGTPGARVEFEIKR